MTERRLGAVLVPDVRRLLDARGGDEPSSPLVAEQMKLIADADQLRPRQTTGQIAYIQQPLWYRPDIDGLRAVAIILVVAFHAFPRIITGGFVGVDVFFVISGYLISRIILTGIEEKRFSLANFYAGRIRRLFPALIAVLCSVYGFGWFVLFGGEFAELGLQVAASAGFANNFILLRQVGYFDTSAITKPLLHTWSLGVEEQFYLLIPAAFLLLHKIFGKVGLSIVGLGIISFGLNVYLSSNSLISFYSPYTRVWEFLLGSMLTLAKTDWGNGKFSGARNLMSCAGLCTIVVPAFLLSESNSYPGFWALLPTLGTVMCLAAGSQSFLNRRLLSGAPCVKIGLISYPLYLWHWPLLSYAAVLTNDHVPDFLRLVLIALAFLLAWITFSFLESPIRFGSRKRTTTLTLGTLMIVVGLIGYLADRNEGFVFRSANRIMGDNSFSQPYKESCETLTGKYYLDDRCNVGTSRERSSNVVLVGDSFANSYAPMMNSLAKSAGLKLGFIQFGRGRCPGLIDYGPPFCRDIEKRIYEYIESHREVETVILANAWQLYVNGTAWEDHSESRERFDAALRKTVETLKSSGKRVIVFLAPPLLAIPKACITRYSGYYVPCDIDKERALAGESNYRSYLLPHLQQSGLEAFDPFDYLCDEKACRVSEGKKIFYNDESGHLSTFGGEYLALHARDRLRYLLGINRPD